MELGLLRCRGRAQKLRWVVPMEEQALGQKHSPGRTGRQVTAQHTWLERLPTPPLQGPAERYRDGTGEGGAKARGRDDKGRGKEQSVLNSVAFK